MGRWRIPFTAVVRRDNAVMIERTITDVQIHTSATAAAADAGWVDLTPNLKNSPQQVDLLGIADPNALLPAIDPDARRRRGVDERLRPDALRPGPGGRR